MRDAFRPPPNLAQDPLSAARDRLDYERSLALFTELVGTRFRLLGLLPIVSVRSSRCLASSTSNPD
jgi:hypothetical protein